MASNSLKATYLVLWTLLDLAITTMLYPQQFQHYRATFLSDLLHYNVFHSMFDIWVCSMIRMSIIVGVLFGFLRNTTEGARRVRKATYLVLAVAAIMWDFAIVKLLLLAEHTSNFDKPFFWALFSWSLVSSVIFFLNWQLLGTFKSLKMSGELPASRSVNATPEERRSLLDENNSHGNRANKPSADGKEKDEENQVKLATVGRLLSYSKPDWPFILMAFSFLLISSTAEIFTPWYTGQVIEGIAIKKDQSQFVRSIILMAVFSAASAMAAGVRGGCFSLCIARLNMRIRKTLFSALLSQEIGFYDVTQTGEITSRLTADTSVMSDTLGLNTNVFLRSLVTSIGVCVFMLKLSWQLSMVTLIGLPIILIISKMYGDYYETLAKQIQDSQAKANEVANEVSSSMKTVRSFAGENDEKERYSTRLLNTYKIQKKEAVAYAGYMWCSELFALSLVVATLYYGGVLVLDGRLTGGELVSFILYQLQLGYQLESISSVFTGLMQATGASEKVFQFITRQPSISNDGNRVSHNLKGKIEFRNVTFCYPSRPESQVIKNISFTVEPGEVVALVGPSGGGKSSCISLLEHFYETQSGEVLLDDTPIKEYDHNFLHQKIALVSQEPVLYARSIQENIAYGLGIWNMDMVSNAAKMANAHQFITELHDKYDTQTGEKGLQLSGGQKQRVAIARAIIRNPTVLLLDEATSALDAESEHLVQEAIHKNMQGRTVIIVAHRLSTVERANRIIVINKGMVVEQGTHRDLLQAGGLYSKLVQRQLLGMDIGLDAGENRLDGANGRVLKPNNPNSTQVHSTSPNRSNCGSFKSVDSSEIKPPHHRKRSFQQSDGVSFQVGSPKYGSMSESPIY